MPHQPTPPVELFTSRDSIGLPMPGTNPSPAQPVHWSKDFVEHLRTVHLSLVAVSVAIIIIVVSASPYKPAVAVRELHQILELKKLWSIQWARNHGSHEPLTLAEVITGEEIPLGPHVTLLHSNKVLLGTVNASDFKNPRSEWVELLLPKDNYIEQNSEKPGMQTGGFPASPSEFEKWWDDLSQPFEVDFPSGIPRQVSGGKASSLVFFGDGLDSFDPFYHDRALQLELSLVKEFQPLPKYSLALPVKHDFVYIDIPIITVDHVQLGQAQLATFFGNWKIGDFKHSFSDLKQAAREFESLELEDVEKILDAEAAKGAEVFEVLGIKVPVDRVTVWGSLILLGVQTYLFLFLKQLSGKLGPHDAGWDVPWIGIDQTEFAQRMLFLSLVLLPCIAVAVLGGRAISLMFSDYRDPAVWWKLTVSFQQGIVLGGKILLIVAAFTGACVLAGQSWKYRPQLIPDSSPQSTPTESDYQI
jgi:hypothetical protein